MWIQGACLGERRDVDDDDDDDGNDEFDVYILNDFTLIQHFCYHSGYSHVMFWSWWLNWTQSISLHGGDYKGRTDLWDYYYFS